MMSNSSPRLDLPYLSPAQAQKHVTVNEALERIDSIAQLVVEEFDALSPPPAPDAGRIWALGATPSGDWNGQGGNLAIATPGNGWLFIQPAEGWRAYGLVEDELRILRNSVWSNQAAQGVNQFGVGATPDVTNRFVVSSPATLLNHAGDSHRLKVNKAGATDTASLLFQSNWTGHAEMGLSGNTDFSIKVSADGNTWQQPFVFNGVTGAVTGDAVQSDLLAVEPGKLVQVGSFGLGKAVSVPNDNVDEAAASGFYFGSGGAGVNASGGDNPFPASSDGFALQVVQTEDAVDAWAQVAVSHGAAPQMRLRTKASGNSVGDWVDVASVENGSNANGRYIRYSDGRLICMISEFELVQRSISDCHAVWTFPATFVSSSDIVVQAQLVAKAGSVDPLDFADDATPAAHEISMPISGAPSINTVDVAVLQASGGTNFAANDKLYCSLIATGRWK